MNIQLSQICIYVRNGGITQEVKSLINSLIFNYDILIPKKIEKNLDNKYKKNIE